MMSTQALPEEGNKVRLEMLQPGGTYIKPEDNSFLVCCAPVFDKNEEKTWSDFI